MHHVSAAYCYTCYTFRGLTVSVCVLGTPVNARKTTDPIDMPVWRGGQIKHTPGWLVGVEFNAPLDTI